MNNIRLFFIIAIILLVSPILSYSLELSIEDPAYNSLDKLAAIGVIDNVFIDNRPLSRNLFARLVLDLSALNNLPSTLSKVEKHILTKELNYLKVIFAVDLKKLQHVDFNYNYSIADPLQLSFKYGGIKNGNVSKVDNSNARIVDDQAGVEWINNSWFTIGNSFGFFGQIWKENRNDNYNIGLNNIYVFQNINKFRLVVGSLSQWWGTGRHGTLLLTNNAPPMSLVKLENSLPYNLPFKAGYFKFNAFLGDMGKVMVHPRAKLFGLKLSFKLQNIIDIGFSRVTMFNGDNMPNLSVVDFVKLYFLDPNQSGKYEVNELSSIDFRLHMFNLIGLRADLYGEIGGEDEAGFRPTKLGYVAGIYFPLIPFISCASLRIEYADNHVKNFPNVWYNHTIYSTGYRYEGDIVGHHMGTDSSDFYIATEILLSNTNRVQFSFDYERHNLSVTTQESKREYNIYYTKHFNEQMSIISEYEYEIIKNKGQVAGLSQRGHTIQISYAISL